MAAITRDFFFTQNWVTARRADSPTGGGGGERGRGSQQRGAYILDAVACHCLLVVGYRIVCLSASVAKSSRDKFSAGGYLPRGAIYSDVKSRYPIFTKLRRSRAIHRRGYAPAIIAVLALSGTANNHAGG